MKINIMDLSSPDGHRINNDIDKEECRFHYIFVDIAAAQIAKLYPPCLRGQRTGL